MTKKLQQPATSPESWKPTPVELELGYDPVFQTPRFDVFLTMVVRNPGLGFGRDVYMAWFRDEDVPRSVCEVTLFGNFVEWLHVCEQHRRQGIATEVLQALEQHLGVLSFEGATEFGEKFVEAYNAKHPGDEDGPLTFAFNKDATRIRGLAANDVLVDEQAGDA